MDNHHTERWAVNERSDWRYWKSRLRVDTELTPLRISLAYVVLGLTAVVIFDVLFIQYLSDPLLKQVQTVKGTVEVFLTAGFIFILTARRETQLQENIDRLNQQHEQLQVLHRVLRHNLRNDLNVIQGYMSRIQTGLETAQFDSECAKILETTEQLTRYTEQANRIKGISEGDNPTRTYDLTELIPRLVADHPRVTSDIDTSVSVPDSATVVANHMFESALTEVLTNAIEHNDSETQRVEIEVLPENGTVHVIEIRVMDNGPGIPNAELKSLREGEEEPVVHLSGLGLWFVSWTIRQSRGRLNFEENEHGGTTVCIQVPRESTDSDRLMPLTSLREI
jgi:signal transduction histidine kinase